ncbi:hypothetical protein AVEN_3378-2 [Araneus ventricosus]|uniref:POGZ/Z280C-D-like double Zinc finger domain-containing protein n=1 Tax=Araneus ventricosus TaxID=182803 RepID=A0A4Y2KET0_ARAVE|nr:hypothetical protein AVEN_3378-2 [Araneus ventricosus]
MSNKSTDIIPPYFCCISQCRNYRNSNAKIDLYPLPDDLMQREKCCAILGIPLDVGLSSAARVCALHFKSKVGNYRPPPPSVPQALSTQPLAFMIDDGRRLNFKPILPRMQTAFPTPVQQPFTLQQPITLTFNPRLMTNMQQNIPPKEPPNDTNTDNVESIDDGDDSVKKDSSPCNSSDITLQLECEEDLLSTTQLNAYMKDLVDFCNASDLIRRLPPPEPRGSSSPFLISNNPELDEMPPLEPIPNISTISSAVTLSSIPNSQFVHIVSPSNKGISVVPNSLLKNALSNLTKGETISSSSAVSSRPLFVNSPILAPRNVAATINDKNPAFISVNGKQLSSSSFGANLSSNGLNPQYGQIPTVATSNAAVNILSNVKLNSTIPVSGSSPRPQTVMPSPLPIAPKTSLFSNLSPLANSSPASILPKNLSGIQSFQILPEKYKILNALSNNSAIPVMLLKAIDSNDVGQSFNTITTSASSSPLTILGREPDETEPCAASLCDVTLSEEPGQMFFPQEQNTSSNDQSTMLNQGNGSSSDTISVDDKAKESPVSAEEKQPSSNNTNTEIGPVIVDVISAKEGATEFYNANTIPNILLDKSKKCEDSNDASANSQLDTSTKPPTDKVVYCTVDKMYSMSKDSIFSLQKFIPVIINGHQIFSEPIHMFRIKTPMPAKRVEEAENLRKRLRQENFIPWAVWWLIQRRYMPMVHPCSFCGSKKFIVDKNSNYPDGFCWTCANTACPVQKPIRRPSFFERFKLYSIQELLLLTYHWACQSSFEEITQDVDLDSEKIWYYFKALQELCHQVATRKGQLGLAQSSMVEASAIKMGNVFILGAVDRRTRYVRLEALTETEAYQSSRHINILEKWMNPNGTIITENKLPNDCLATVRKLAADPSVTDRYSTLPHTLNISKYLSKNMTSIFGSINQHSLKTNDIQGFLYELQWREKYGKFVDMSFWSILNHIRDLNVEEGSPVQVRKGAFSCDSPSLELNSALHVRWGPNLEDYVEKNIVMNPQEPSYKLSGKDTKSYSKDANSCFSDYFHDIPEVQGGSAMVTSKSLLAVKIRFGESPADIDFYKSDAICLGLKLKSEGFISNPVKWLVRKSFVKNISTCYVCQGVAFLKESSRFSDGCSWACQNEKCKFENVFRRPSFFARFPQYPMSHVAGMIFHWIVQSDESLINTDVPMDACKILDAWRSFQGLCSSALKRKKEKIGGEEHIVEVAVVKFGKLYILGALDRKTKRSLLQAFPAEVGKIDTLYYTLHSWILPESIIVIDATKNFQMHRRYDGYNIMLANTFIVDRHHPSCHVLNIKYYLLKHLSNMFCHIKPDFMRLEVLQSYLEELMWRERYGKEPQLAFAYIMNEIFYNDLRDKSEFQKRKRDPEFIPIKFKELRVVLRRIPKSVLKFYGCEIPDSSKTSESIDTTFSETTEKEPSSSVLDIADDTQAVPDTVQCSSQRLSESDDEVIIIDPDLPSSDIPENKKPVLEHSPISEEQSPISEEQSPISVEQSPISEEQFISEEQSTISEPPDVSESNSSSTTSDSCTNKVQPLVIKMHKKRKKFRSYLKSELEKVKKLELEKSLSNDISDIPNIVPRTDLDMAKCSMVDSPDIISSDSSHSNTWDTQSTDSTKSNNKVARKRSAAHSSYLQKEERPICIECGEPVGHSYDHFVKQFKCTDCKKKSVYTTCCSKAFFEHRGSILFGKRMPRRKKEDYGLHRPMTMQSPWHCACGFNTKDGNKLASHMVNCRKRTCYYHQNVL